MRRKNRYKPTYQNGVQYIDNEFNPSTEKEQKLNQGVDIGIEAAGATLGPWGMVASLGNKLSQSIKGDGTDGVRNTISNSISPVNAFKSIASGNFEDAIPIVGGFKEAKRKKNAKKAYEQKVERVENQQEANSLVVNDSTEMQSIAKYGKRYKKGTKGINGDTEKSKTPKRGAALRPEEYEDYEAKRKELLAKQNTRQIDTRFGVANPTTKVDNSVSSPTIGFKVEKTREELLDDYYSQLQLENLPDPRFRNNPEIGSNFKTAPRNKFIKGTMKEIKYETGTSSITAENQKSVEVEKDEMIFRKVNGSWKLVADFKGGLTHEQGGEDTTVQEGDVIFPGTKRTKIMGLLSSNGTVSKESVPSFESERMKLPTDTKEDKAQAGLSGAGYAAAFQALPAITNLIEGTKPSEKVNRRTIKPQRIRYVDTSQEQINAVEESYREDKENISKQVGGNTGVLLANVGAASSRRAKNKTGVYANVAREKQQVENANTQIANDADRVNTNLQVQYDIMDSQNMAAKRAFVREGITGASQIGQQYIKNKGLEERDSKLMDLEERKMKYLESAYPNFTTDKEGNVILRSQETEKEAEPFSIESIFDSLNLNTKQTRIG